MAQFSDCIFRPYHVEYTGSHLNTEVKQRRAGLVLGWESPVLQASFFFLICMNIMIFFKIIFILYNTHTNFFLVCTDELYEFF